MYIDLLDITSFIDSLHRNMLFTQMNLLVPKVKVQNTPTHVNSR